MAAPAVAALPAPASAGYVSDVCRYVLHGPIRAGDERIVVVLTTAFDESGSHDDARCISIAGYVASVAQWELFTKEWVKALRAEGVPPWPPPKPGEPIPDPFFHMTDFENREKQFKGWSTVRRVRLF